MPDTHLFRVLWLFWTQQDLEREAWPWVEQLLPAAGTLDPQARAELAWAAAVLAVDVGDDAAALAARQRLAPLLGRYDDALRHLLDARDLAEGTGGDWLGAGPRVQLGILAVLRGRLDEARPLLDEALDLSMTARSTPFVTLCLAGYAQLAFADGHPDRAALPEGAAEGLRRRVGQPAWPHLRRAEGELAAQVRHRLGDSRFDQAISAGSRLTQREAVASSGTADPLRRAPPATSAASPGVVRGRDRDASQMVIRFSFQLTLGIAVEVLIEMAS